MERERFVRIKVTEKIVPRIENMCSLMLCNTSPTLWYCAILHGHQTVMAELVCSSKLIISYIMLPEKKVVINPPFAYFVREPTLKSLEV